MFFIFLFLYDCFKPSEDKIYHELPQNLNSTHAPLPISISSNSSSILLTSGLTIMFVSAFTTVWSVVREFSVIVENGIALTIIQSSPCVE